MSSVRSGNEGALLEQLKIDHSFVRDVLTNRNDMAIARSIVALAHSLSLSVIPRGWKLHHKVIL